MKTFVVIPTKWKSPETTSSLIKNFQNDPLVDEVIFIDNGDIADAKYIFEENVNFPSKVNFLLAKNKTIYEMWNKGWDFIEENRVTFDYFNLAILNDDIAIKPGTIGIMAAYLRTQDDLAVVYPDYDESWDSEIWQPQQLRYTESTFGAGGMAGFCFMVKGELGIRVDENLKLYWGDDDLVKQIDNRGLKIGRIVGLPIQHIGSATINNMNYTERMLLMEADRRYFNQKYGENRSPVY